mmetsp:Transcript_125461/g.362965  ORF Transcript_125461/g.362965 Transcript_125461/m.362965 type:complete len:343 (-) Transcript_125461:1535-2563(-)
MGTQMSLAPLFTACAAWPVLLLLMGLPSVKTMTTDFALGRPLLNSDFASERAMEVNVVPANHFACCAFFSTSWMLLVKRDNQTTPQSFSMSGDALASEEVQLSSASTVVGPLNNNRAKFTMSFLAPCIAWISLTAIFCDCSQPFLPKLPLPSRRMMTSNGELHRNVVFPGARSFWQDWVLHLRNCKRCLLFHRGQEPRPFALTFTLFMRIRRPEPHALEQALHLPQLLNLHGALHACTLHAWVSDSFGHGSPPYFGSWIRCRSLVMMPPPQSEEQLDHADHSATLHGTGHAWRLHVRCILSGGQAVPLAGAKVTFRVRFWTPPPQLLEHCSSTQSDTWQSVA